MKIVSLDQIPAKFKKIIKDSDLSDKDLEEAEGLLAWPRQITAETALKLKNLKALQTFSAGVDDLNFSVLPKNIKIFSNAGAYSKPVAELAWALALSLAKNVGKKYRLKSYTLYNKKALVLGAGGIGSEIAKIAKKGFSCKVTGISRSFKNPSFFDTVLGVESLENELAKADIIFSSLPLNKLTKGLLNAKNLYKIKQCAIIVNVGRAEVFDEEDLFEFLKERKDVRFGTDVFWRHNGQEDFSSKFWQLDNFTGTPHTAGAWENEEVINKAKSIACKNIMDYFRKGNAKNEVKLEDYV
ncbi:MAG: NAD(P)-dependent oxidoreductase [Nitrososphaeria archaeon]